MQVFLSTKPPLIKNILHLFFSLTIFLLCSVIITFAVKAALANVNSYDLNAWHQRWHQRWQNETSTTFSENNMIEAGSVMQEMIDNQASHPYHLILAAKQLEWQNYFLQVNLHSSTLKPSDSSDIEQLYKQAALLRPTWASTYVQMARNSWHNGESFSKIMLYLDLAKRAAPYTESTLLAYTEIGLKQWALLEQQQRSDVAQYALLAMKQPFLQNKVKEIMRVPVVHKRMCNLAAFVKQSSKLCQK